MPSTKDPNAIVHPGPGKVPAGTVPASSLLFPPGSGGGGGDLQAHITDPLDAHLASAIGINPVDPVTGIPILTSAGGDIDGESVLDLLLVLSTLLPQRPDRLGFNVVAVPNSGVPTWTSSVSGGFRRAGAVVPTHHIVTAATSTLTASALFYPADRGVLALYKTTAGDYFNAGQTTLVAALSLGSGAALSGVPQALFVESHRSSGQSDYAAAGTGLDQFSLTNRLPVLKDYSIYGNPILPYAQDFVQYQVAQLAISQTILSGDAGSYLLVHWRDSFATSLAAIQPAHLTSGNFGNANAYSAIRLSDFDSDDLFNVNRHNLYRDAASTTTQAGTVFTNTLNGSPTVAPLSGVQAYTGAGLSWNVDVRASSLFANSFYLGTVDNTANIPAGFASPRPPMRLLWGDFGGTNVDLSYDQLKPVGGSTYTITVAPQPSDVAQYTNTTLAINSPTPYTVPGAGYARLSVELNKPYNNGVSFFATTPGYLFNSFPRSGGSTASTTTLEPLVDEKYRYVSTYAASSTTAPIVPAGSDAFNSATVLTASGSDLQVIGSQVVYPKVDYSSVYRPTGQPNYAAVLSGDPTNNIRRYVRAFHTGIARNTGKIRLRGLAQADFASAGAFTGNAVTDHSGGAIVEIKVPGVTGWLDLGRVKGDPDLGTTDGRGCRTSLVVSGSDLILTYDTSLFTADNGTGQYPLFVRVSLIKGPGTNKVVDELEWLAPLAFIPSASTRTEWPDRTRLRARTAT